MGCEAWCTNYAHAMSELRGRSSGDQPWETGAGADRDITPVPFEAGDDPGVTREEAYARAEAARKANAAMADVGTGGADRVRENDSRATGGEEMGKATEKKSERISELEKELAESKADQSKLIDVVTKQVDRNEKLQAKVDKLEDENKRLKAEKEDKSGPAAPSEAIGPKLADSGEQAGHLERTGHGRLHWPGDKAIAVGTASVPVIDAVATNAHILSSGQGTVGSAIVGLGIAGALWGREKYEQRKVKHGDGSED